MYWVNALKQSPVKMAQGWDDTWDAMIFLRDRGNWNIEISHYLSRADGEEWRDLWPEDDYELSEIIWESVFPKDPYRTP